MQKVFFINLDNVSLDKFNIKKKKEKTSLLINPFEVTPRNNIYVCIV